MSGDFYLRALKLVHPTEGIKRGILDHVEQGKGGRDRDDKLIPVSVGELREVHAVLNALLDQVARDAA